MKFQHVDGDPNQGESYDDRQRRLLSGGIFPPKLALGDVGSGRFKRTGERMKVGAMVGTCAWCGALMVVRTDLPAGYCPCCGKYTFGAMMGRTIDLEAAQEKKRRILGDRYQTATEFFRDNEDPRGFEEEEEMGGGSGDRGPRWGLDDILAHLRGRLGGRVVG